MVISIARAFGTGRAPGWARQDRAGVRVLGGAVLELAAAEHFRPCLEVGVHLEPHDRLPLTAHEASPWPRAAPPRRPRAPRTIPSRCSSGPWVSITTTPVLPPRVGASRRRRGGRGAVEHTRVLTEDALGRDTNSAAGSSKRYVMRGASRERDRSRAPARARGRSGRARSRRTAAPRAAGRPAVLPRGRTGC